MLHLETVSAWGLSKWMLPGLCWLVAMQGGENLARAEVERNNWAVLVEASRYWYNYRHSANVLTFYHTIKRLGIPDSQIILMMAEDFACNSRNMKPGTIFNDQSQRLNLYGEHVEVDYRGDEVSVNNFLRLITGRHPPNTPRNKRLLTDSMSNIFFFITGHSGEEFIKFQDWEEITSNDIADAFGQMHQQKRYKRIFWIADTCQAASLQNQFYSPGIIGMGSSDKKENSYSHHVDHRIGVAVIDRFTYYSLDYLNRLKPTSKETLNSFYRIFNPRLLHAHPQIRMDLANTTTDNVRLTDFWASAGMMHFQSRSLQLVADPHTKDQSMPDLLLAADKSSKATCSTTKDGSSISAGTDDHWSIQLLSALLTPGKLGGHGRGAVSLLSTQPGEISTLPLGWRDGQSPMPLIWLLAFAALMCLAGFIL